MQLYDYQQKAVNKAINVYNNNGKSFNLFFEMGLGKTITAIEIAKNVKHNTILIVCPKSLIEMWAYEMSKHFPAAVRLATPDGIYFANCDAYHITNYESLRQYNQTLCPDVCIFDEVHRLKNPKSLTNKRMQHIVHARFTLKLTGTPVTRNYTDLYGILNCTSDKVLQMTLSQFQAKYVKIGGTASIKKLMDSIEPFTEFARLEDHIDMPGYEDVIIPVPMSIADRVKLDTVCRSSKNALARIIDAQRITSNVYGPKSLVLTRLVSDILDDGRKVVIFTKFDEEFDFFMYQYKDIAVGINGSTKDRDKPVYEFQNNPDIKVFVGNIQTAGVGLTLTAATDCIFYSETYAWGDADQSKARIYRIGQNRPCRYYHLLVSNSIDELIYKNLIEKTNLIEEFKKIYGGI